MTTRLRQLLSALLLPLLAPLHLASLLLHFRAARLRAARDSGDRGAISIELALAVIALMVVAGGVLLAIKSLATSVSSKVPTSEPTG